MKGHVPPPQSFLADYTLPPSVRDEVREAQWRYIEYFARGRQYVTNQMITDHNSKMNAKFALQLPAPPEPIVAEPDVKQVNVGSRRALTIRKKQKKARKAIVETLVQRKLTPMQSQRVLRDLIKELHGVRKFNAQVKELLK